MRTPLRRKAFTLIEMLVVIIVISILMGILLPVIQGARARARIQMARVQISEVEKALEAFRDAFGAYPPEYVTVIPQETDGDNFCDWPPSYPDGQIGWRVVTERRLRAGAGADGQCNTTQAGDDVQSVAVGASALPGQLLVDVGSNGVLDTAATTDDVIEDWTFFLFLDTTTTPPTPRPVDLNGRAHGNDDDNDGVALDSAECLYYFLCMRFLATPGTAYTNAAFIDTTNSYLTDPTTFEFRPGGYLPATNAGPFYAVKPQEVRDTDGDGYLELCDQWGNPLRYVSGATRMIPYIVESASAPNGVADTTAVGDDRQLIPVGSSAVPGAVVVHPGPNWFRDTPDASVDPSEAVVLKRWSGGKTALIYSTGPNGLDNIAMSDASGGARNADDDGDGIVDNEDDVSNMQ
ncbi:MAG: prepilin-type N-terminal cleavage/methylation domain-containing protein [Planctomycetota bacterium]